MDWLLIPQLFGFLASLMILSSLVNFALVRWLHFSPKYLPWFAWGWVVYFLIYILSRQWPAPVQAVEFLFSGMALGIPLLFGVWKVFRKGTEPFLLCPSKNLLWEKGTWVFIGVFGSVMLYVGPYLEFPSDPLFHAEAIQSWEAARWMDSVDKMIPHGKRYSHFAYFIYHWLLTPSDVSFGGQSGLAFLCAVLQSLLLLGFIRFTRLFTDNSWVGWFGGVASLGLFGIGIFSFYRYYILADSLISYLVFLEALALVCCFFLKERIRYLLLLPPLVVFCWFNHRQGVLFLFNAVVGIGVLLTLFQYKNVSVWLRRFWVLFIGLSIPVSFSVSSLEHALGLGGWGAIFTRLNHALGLGGWIAVLGALFILFKSPSKKHTILAAICLWPCLVLLNPFVLVLLNKVIMNPLVFYRVIYGSVYWVFLMIFVEYVYTHRNVVLRWWPWRSFAPWPQRNFLSRWGLVFALSFFVMGTSLLPQAPVRGKIPNLLMKTDARLDGRELESAIRYLRQVAPKQCRDPHAGKTHFPMRSFILSDTYINHYLIVTGYFYTISDRWSILHPLGHKLGLVNKPPPKQWELTVKPEIDKKINFPESLKQYRVCYIVLHNRHLAPKSLAGQESGHWPADYVQAQQRFSRKLHQWVKAHPHHFELAFQDEAVQIYKVLYH